MQIRYISSAAMHIRTLQMKLFTPDSGAFAQYVTAMHGFVGNMESKAITELAKRLTERNTALITFNFPGHGSDTQDTLFSVPNCILDLFDAAAYMRIQFPQADWRGIYATSFGGYIVLNALRLIPDSVRIVLRSPAVNMDEVLARIVEKDGGGMAKYGSERSVMLGFKRKLLVPYALYQELCRYDVFQTDHRREMLLIDGDCDSIVLPQDTAAFCEWNPLIVRKTVSGANHLFGRPAELTQAIDAAAAYLIQ